MVEKKDKISDEAMNRLMLAVGRMIVIGSALDSQVNKLLPAVCHLSPSPFLEPIIATLEFNKKCAVIKARAKHMTRKDFSQLLISYAKKAEKSYGMRNTAAHSIVSFEGGQLVLRPPGAYKILASMNIKEKEIEKVDIVELEQAIKIGDELLATGRHIIEQFSAINEFFLKEVESFKNEQSAPEA